MRRFNFQCKRCDSLLEATTDRCGQNGKCPTCDAQFRIPDVDPRTGLALGPADPGDDGQDPTPMHAYGAAGDKAPRIERSQDDRMIIRCPRCGHTSPIDVNNCNSCGLPFTLDGNVRRTGEMRNGFATASLVCGLGSLFCVVVPVLGPVAIVCGILALREIQLRRTTAGGSAATSGIVSGILGTMIAVAWFV